MLILAGVGIIYYLLCSLDLKAITSFYLEDFNYSYVFNLLGNNSPTLWVDSLSPIENNLSRVTSL